MNISFKEWVSKAKMPLVTTDDGALCFLIDTGASYNVLIKEAYEKSGSIFQRLGRNDYMIGMNGEPQKIFMVSGDITLGGEVYAGEYGVMEMTNAIETVIMLTGQRIDGALGVDFLTRYGIVLDFHNMQLRSVSANDFEQAMAVPEAHSNATNLV